MSIWHMRIGCWEPKATNTHSDYVILTAFPREQWLHERATMLRYTHIACLVPYQVLFTSSAPLCLPNGPRLIHLDLITLMIGLFDEEYTSRNLMLRNFLCPFITFSPSGPSISPNSVFLKILNLYRLTSVPETKFYTNKNRDQNYNFVYFFINNTLIRALMNTIID